MAGKRTPITMPPPRPLPISSKVSPSATSTWPWSRGRRTRGSLRSASSRRPRTRVSIAPASPDPQATPHAAHGAGYDSANQSPGVPHYFPSIVLARKQWLPVTHTLDYQGHLPMPSIPTTLQCWVLPPSVRAPAVCCSPRCCSRARRSPEALSCYCRQVGRLRV